MRVARLGAAGLYAHAAALAGELRRHLAQRDLGDGLDLARPEGAQVDDLDRDGHGAAQLAGVHGAEGADAELQRLVGRVRVLVQRRVGPRDLALARGHCFGSFNSKVSFLEVRRCRPKVLC